jgi:hypothetical protein
MCGAVQSVHQAAPQCDHTTVDNRTCRLYDTFIVGCMTRVDRTTAWIVTCAGRTPAGRTCELQVTLVASYNCTG